MVGNRQRKLTAPTVHWSLSFCIARCSVQLVGSVVLGEHDFVLEFDYDEELGKFSRMRELR